MEIHLVIIGSVALLAAGLAVALLHLARRRRQRRRKRVRVRPPLPVVLAHGLLGFDEVQLATGRVEYFRGVAGGLEKLGTRVYRPQVPPVASVAARAARLADYVRQLPDQRVNIIAHSLGGLDARFAIAQLGLDQRVASLTTIGTPHLGTPLADYGTSVLEKVGIRRLLRLCGLDLEGFFELSEQRMTGFNQHVEDASTVAYGSVVSVVTSGTAGINPLLLPCYLLLKQRVGANDGLVPWDSQVWGEVLFEAEADHWAQVGWSRHFDAPALYEHLLRELRGRGC
jgi:triacylglycerol lipase